MKIFEATVEDILAVAPELAESDAEDILTFGDPNDTIEEGINKLNGEPCGECGTI